ncbi:hypothetical protein, partial [Salmonella enterica]|uniref:hypothetical protein n=1 Tax=Salmonella enterica TaxID=28901 RepID=UPI00398C7E81
KCGSYEGSELGVWVTTQGNEGVITIEIGSAGWHSELRLSGRQMSKNRKPGKRHRHRESHQIQRWLR